ncbi:MAG: shikimate kinase [Firmicutes bacterium]|nr:shikimate kinase [Bacillota bacterium]
MGNDNNKGLYGLLGRKLGHSFSPQIHKAFGGYDYELFEREPEEVGDFIKNGGFKAINVTIPYKRAVMEFCDELSEVAIAANSVNTVIRMDDGRIIGDNTDYYGFRYMLESEGLSPAGQKTLVLGSGGVSGTVIKALQDMGASEVITISRSGENNYDNLDKHYDAGFIVNTTPVGMYPDNEGCVIDVKNFPSCKGCADLVYNPLRTRFVVESREAGIPAVSGLSMLVAQAAKACNLFIGIDVPDEAIREQVAILERGHENIVLIGMPGCGKSSVAAELAKITGKPLVDTDTLIKEMTGRTPSEIINEDGEPAFRDIETKALAEALHTGGKIIASGGGIVERDENRLLMIRNSRVLYIKRDLENLPSNDRPVSQRDGVKKIYERRHGKYEGWSDFTVDNNGELNSTVEEAAWVLGYK